MLYEFNLVSREQHPKKDPRTANRHWPAPARYAETDRESVGRRVRSRAPSAGTQKACCARKAPSTRHRSLSIQLVGFNIMAVAWDSQETCRRQSRAGAS